MARSACKSYTATLMVIMMCMSVMVQLAAASRPGMMAADEGGRSLLQTDDDYDDDYNDYEEDEPAARGTISADGWEYLLGVGCNDKPETKLDVSLRECHEACEEDSKCRSYSYNTSRGRCYLKEGPCDEEDQNHKKHDNISGRKQ